MRERVHAAMWHGWRLLGQASDGARALEPPGVLAVVVPACPERAVVNSVLYRDPGALAEAYEEIAEAYAEVGANWTVWVHEGDREAATLLERKGHERNADVEWVAVVPEARGRGLSGKLLGHALADAAERGIETSTLVATQLG